MKALLRLGFFIASIIPEKLLHGSIVPLLDDTYAGGVRGKKYRAFYLTIIGRVQGVFFRAETKRVADSLGLTGWVRNCEDGSVEVFAQGPEEKLQLFERWCWKGPAAAEVQNVEQREVREEDCGAFEIRY
jgi:acylphosphatase